MCKISRVSGFLIYIFAIVILAFVLIHHSQAGETEGETETYTYTKTTTETYTRPKKPVPSPVTAYPFSIEQPSNVFPMLEDENGDPIPVPAPKQTIWKGTKIPNLDVKGAAIDGGLAAVPLDNKLEARLQERDNQAAILDNEDEVETE